MSVRRTATKNEAKITILRSCLQFLRLYNFWPKNSEELSPGVGYKIKFFAIMAFSLIYGLMTSILHIVYVKTNHYDVDLHEDIVLILLVITVFVISLEFYFKQGQIAQILLQLCNYKFGKPKDLERIERLLSLLSKGLFFFVVFGIVSYGLVPVIEQSKCEKYFNKKKIEELCGYYVPTPPSLIIKTDLIILKPLTIFMQFLWASVLLLSAAMVGLLVFEMNVHLVVHIRHLKSLFKSLHPSRDVEKELYNLVKYHQHIIELMDSINKCCSRALCIHVFLTSSILGCIINQIMDLTWQTPVGPVMHLTCWTLALFLNSLGGEIILNESIDIGTALYFSDWLELDQSLKKDIWFIIVRTQKPLVLKAGSFGYMSLGVFVAVLKGLHTLTVTLNMV